MDKEFNKDLPLCEDSDSTLSYSEEIDNISPTTSKRKCKKTIVLTILKEKEERKHYKGNTTE